jgi:magnesium transporter
MNKDLTIVEDLLQGQKQEELYPVLKTWSPVELANLILHRSLSEQMMIFEVLPTKLAAESFSFLPLRVQQELVRILPSSRAASILNALPPDDRTSLLEELPRSTVDELIKLLLPEEQILTLSLLGYPEGSVGRLMTPDYIAVKRDWTVDQVLEFIRHYGRDSETINVIYVVNEEGKLLDDLRLRELLFVPRSTQIKGVADSRFVALHVYDSEEEAIKVFRNHDRVALPVIDQRGILLGIVTIDDVLNLVQEESTRHIQKIGGTEALDEPYMQAPFLSLMRKRATWLMVLFLGEMLTTSAMGYFEGELTRAVVLAVFIPLIISSGGNSGSQASTLVIRALALGEVKLIDWWKVMRREFFSGLFLGVLLGLIGFIRVSIGGLTSDVFGPHWLLLAWTVSFSLVGVVLWGTLVGGTLPLILKRLHVDPATSSAPFVATLVDVTGLVIYFLLAIFLLRGTLL